MEIAKTAAGGGKRKIHSILKHQAVVSIHQNLPPFTSPLVHTADMDNAVIVVTTVANNTITVDSPIPA